MANPYAIVCLRLLAFTREYYSRQRIFAIIAPLEVDCGLFFLFVFSTRVHISAYRQELFGSVQEEIWKRTRREPDAGIDEPSNRGMMLGLLGTRRWRVSTNLSLR